MKFFVSVISLLISLYLECQPPINFIFSSDTTKTLAYTGKLVNGKANGYGKGVFSNGNIYTGNWKNNCMENRGNIFGKKTAPIHDGLFINNVAERKGKLTWKNGDVYQGDFKNFLREEKGQ